MSTVIVLSVIAVGNAIIEKVNLCKGFHEPTPTPFEILINILLFLSIFPLLLNLVIRTSSLVLIKLGGM